MGRRLNSRSLWVVLLVEAALAVSAAAGLGGCAVVDRKPPGGAADLVLRNGKVITVDDAFSIAQAVAIRGDRIVAVGTNVEVESYGNVLASTAFLQGLCAGDLSKEELDHRDQRYQMLVAGRAVKRA